MIFEPYLGCYSSIFSPNLVCCSWDYGLSAKWSPILNRMSGTWSNFQFILLKHITLICQHDKLPLVRWYAIHSGISPIVSVRIFILFIYYCMKFVARLSQKFLSLWFSNFHSIFAMIGNRSANKFSTITQPWRHLGAILWIHVIIHIFITIHSKSTIFNAHKLQAICQHIGLFISGLYQIRARARASKFRNAQNHL